MRTFREDEKDAMMEYAYGVLDVDKMTDEELHEQYNLCQGVFPTILHALSLGMKESAVSGNLVVYDLAWFKTRAHEVGEELVRRGYRLFWFTGKRFRPGQSAVFGLLDPRTQTDEDGEDS